MLSQTLLGAIAVLVTLGSSTALAGAPVQDLTLDTLEPRVTRLERLLNPKNQLQLYRHLTTLQQELEALRGVVERQQHLIGQLERQLKGLAPAIQGELAKPGEQERTAYEQVWQAVKGLPPPEAIQRLERFIQEYPQSTYSPNAYYWLGQLLFKQNELTRASACFATILRTFPKSNKVSDAMLKIAIITQTQGDTEKAKAIYTRVVQQHADSSAAEQAKQRLAKLS